MKCPHGRHPGPGHEQVLFAVFRSRIEKLFEGEKICIDAVPDLEQVSILASIRRSGPSTWRVVIHPFALTVPVPLSVVPAQLVN